MQESHNGEGKKVNYYAKLEKNTQYIARLDKKIHFLQRKHKRMSIKRDEITLCIIALNKQLHAAHADIANGGKDGTEQQFKKQNIAFLERSTSLLEGDAKIIESQRQMFIMLRQKKIVKSDKLHKELTELPKEQGQLQKEEFLKEYEYEHNLQKKEVQQSLKKFAITGLTAGLLSVACFALIVLSPFAAIPAVALTAVTVGVGVHRTIKSKKYNKQHSRVYIAPNDKWQDKFDTHKDFMLFAKSKAQIDWRTEENKEKEAKKRHMVRMLKLSSDEPCEQKESPKSSPLNLNKLDEARGKTQSASQGLKRSQIHTEALKLQRGGDGIELVP